MEGGLKFDYYFGVEAEQFSFYRVPRTLIKDKRFKDLSSDAKLLYGLMLDRMALSMKNGWLDDENRVYIIYTLENIIDDLNCGKDKGVKILAELDGDKGVGLIERKKRGLGKPTIIYVKNFITCEEAGETKSAYDQEQNEAVPELMEQGESVVSQEFGDVEVKTPEKPKSEDAEYRSPEFGKAEVKTSEKPNSVKNAGRSPEFGKTEVKTSDNPKCRVLKNRSTEFGNSDPNYNNTNYNNMSYNNLINLSGTEQAQEENADGIDTMDEINAYMQLIQENIEYDYYMRYAEKPDRELVEELYQIICDVVCVKRASVRIGKEDYPYELVKSKFLKLNQGHIEYVMGCLKNTTTKIGNIRSYLITSLYNAPNTMNHYYQQEVQHDMYGGGWHEKGIV